MDRSLVFPVVGVAIALVAFVVALLAPSLAASWGVDVVVVTSSAAQLGCSGALLSMIGVRRGL